MTKEEAITNDKGRASHTIEKWCKDMLCEFNTELMDAEIILEDPEIKESMIYCYNNLVAIRKRIEVLQKQGF